MYIVYTLEDQENTYTTTAHTIMIGRIANSQNTLDLRPDERVSRQHARISMRNGSFWVEDLGSRNGTIVNGKVIDGPCQLKMGDHLKIGPLDFEVIIDHSLGGAKHPQVKSVQEAAARTAERVSIPATCAARAALSTNARATRHLTRGCSPARAGRSSTTARTSSSTTTAASLVEDRTTKTRSAFTRSTSGSPVTSPDGSIAP